MRSWHGVDQSVALLRCYESPGCSDSGLQLFCIVGSGMVNVKQNKNNWGGGGGGGITVLDKSVLKNYINLDALFCAASDFFFKTSIYMQVCTQT